MLRLPISAFNTPLTSPLIKVLPSYFTTSGVEKAITPAPTPAGREGNWVDGLRGIAAVLVVVYHLTSAFAPILLSPATSEHGPSHLLQLPILRILFASGQTSVALFFVITGYGSSISAFSRLERGNTEGMYGSIGKAALARPFRIILPTALLTTVAWGLSQVGAFALTRRVDAAWVRNQYVVPSGSISAAVTELVKAQLHTWSRGEDVYDRNQWTQTFLLQASMMVYLILLGTASISQRGRRVVLAALYVYAWVTGTCLTLMNVVVGIVLADLQVTFGSSTTHRANLFSYLVIALSLLLVSFPQDNSSWSSWSAEMENLLRPLLPSGTEPPRYMASLAASTLCLGVFFNRLARDLLSCQVLNWLGSISFPLYLIHNTLIKMVLVPILYLPSMFCPKLNEKGEEVDMLERGNWVAVAVGMAVFWSFLLYLSWLWTICVDPMIARLTKTMVTWLTTEKSVDEKMSLV